jgi:cupin superfamily acireductone dioxygenase involved in methionine salvage
MSRLRIFHQERPEQLLFSSDNREQIDTRLAAIGVRFEQWPLLAGSGLFTLHPHEQVYEVLCTAGDLIGVPNGMRHWFDMGPNPDFVAIRFFTRPDGWVGYFTGDDIAERFPRFN